MTARDRRSGDERRGSVRYPVEMDIQWEAGNGRQPGSMSDVSLDGCFILSSGDVTDGVDVKIFVPLADGMKVQFDAKVANHVYEIGFGVKFAPLSAAQRELLVKIVRVTEGP